jgi:hypothetical protein
MARRSWTSSRFAREIDPRTYDAEETIDVQLGSIWLWLGFETAPL